MQGTADFLRCDVLALLGPHNRDRVLARVRGAVVAIDRGRQTRAKNAAANATKEAKQKRKGRR